jgi:hypothetical protein
LGPSCLNDSKTRRANCQASFDPEITVSGFRRRVDRVSKQTLFAALLKFLRKFKKLVFFGDNQVLSGFFTVALCGRFKAQTI